MKRTNPNKNIIRNRLTEAKKKKEPSMFLSNDDFEQMFAEQDAKAQEDANKVDEREEKKRIENTMAALKALFVDRSIPFTLIDVDKNKHYMDSYKAFIEPLSKIFTDMFIKHKGAIIFALDLSSSPNFENSPINDTKSYLSKWPFSSFTRSEASKKMEDMKESVQVNKLRNGHVMLQIALTDKPKMDYPFMLAFAAGVYTNRSNYKLNTDFIK